jgi:hypothetical protein
LLSSGLLKNASALVPVLWRNPRAWLAFTIPLAVLLWDIRYIFTAESMSRNLIDFGASVYVSLLVLAVVGVRRFLRDT